ncbi:hypothetical protein J2Z19_001150 [Ensifer adhaerens]|uniref:Uncharacterized protein n=1 Tax=Ensifer adhaerens TaxID=106592 RepID=A0ACC5SRF3_ENSAD|nr:hypothetical protein [Ensifer adhaerens]
MDRGDGKTVGDGFERDLGGGLHALGREPDLSQDQRQCHGETTGMSRADEFLRVCARHALETSCKAVGIVFQGPALRRNLPLAVLETAGPFCLSSAIDLHAHLLRVTSTALQIGRYRRIGMTLHGLARRRSKTRPAGWRRRSSIPRCTEARPPAGKIFPPIMRRARNGCLNSLTTLTNLPSLRTLPPSRSAPPINRV